MREATALLKAGLVNVVLVIRGILTVVWWPGRRIGGSSSKEAWDHDEPLEGIVEEVLDYCEEHLDADTRQQVLGYVGLK